MEDCIVDGCPEKAVLRCQDCHIAQYCSSACGQKDWDEYHAEEHHMALCHPINEVAEMSYDSELSSIEVSSIEELPTLGDVFENPLELIEARKRSSRRHIKRGSKRRTTRTRTRRRPKRRRRRRRKPRRSVKSSFVTKAQSKGLTVDQFHRNVIGNKDEYSGYTRLQAALYGVFHR